MSSTRPVRASVILSAATVLALALAVAGFAAGLVDTDDAEVSGPYAEFTRSQMADLTAGGASRNPVLLPQWLPPGTGETDEADFFLLNKPVTDDARKHAGEVWLSSYSVGALPPAFGNVSGYTVYQEWRKTPQRHQRRCGNKRWPNQEVVRHVGDNDLTICLGPHPTVDARRYWTTVGFTSDLSRVTWLRG
jgi:hypothetical protein